MILVPGYYKFITPHGNIDYFHISEIDSAPDRAAYFARISDWHSSGNCVSFFDFCRDNPVKFYNDQFVTIGYTLTAEKLISVSIEEYNKQLVLNIINCGRKNRNQDAFNIGFKVDDFRRALLKYGMES